MSDDTVTRDIDNKTALARALWRSMRETPEGETPEARKEAWKPEKVKTLKVAAKILKRLERSGFILSKT
jgi:hypothetical protein